MRRAFPVLFCLAASLVTARAAIDLNPTLAEYKAEGITFKQLVFKDEKKRITYELPGLWTYRTVGNSVKLIPPNNSGVDITIQTDPATGARSSDDKGVTAVREHFLRGMPQGTQMVKLLSEEQNTIPFKGFTNSEVTASYQALGDTFMRRALYVNLPDGQLIFQLNARKSEFEGLYRTFRASILSWQWVDDSLSTSAR
jgi:hypothetical protein